MDHAETFSHHGRTFVIEAEGWASEEDASAAVIELQSWAMRLGEAETADLHSALLQEREALVHETSYERDAPVLVAVRAAQRLAVRAGLQGKRVAGEQPIVTIDVPQVSIAP